jgi:hypothetical protein
MRHKNLKSVNTETTKLKYVTVNKKFDLEEN